MDISSLEAKARKLRRTVIEMLYKAQSGHPGSSMSTMEMLVALYFGDILRYNPGHLDDPKRDLFILSNGHACPAWYAVLAEANYFSSDELNHLRQLGAKAQGHPHRGSLPGVEVSTGSLGQGLSVGIGAALGFKRQQKSNRVYVMMSDGEQEEGSTWEAVMLGGKLKLKQLIAIVDKNEFQIDGATADVMPSLDPLAEKYQAFGWQVYGINGHSLGEVLTALTAVQKGQKPAVIISHTTRGHGVSFMEGSEQWHAGVISQPQYQQAMKELADA